MNAKSDNVESSRSRQLREFTERLQKEIADEDLLDDIHGVLEDLLWEDESVSVDIRRILNDQHKAGNLRDETLDLVQRMLDRMVTKNIDPERVDPDPEEQGADPFGETTVIEKLEISDELDGGRLQIGSVLRDRFLLQERVSSGSMGVVYKALDRRLAEANEANPSVAIKVLTPQLSRDGVALRALQQEAAKGRCLTHPNIVRFIDLDREEDLYFIVMEWLEGRSLAEILDDSSGKKIDRDTALDIVKQIGKALDYAHRRGVIHADVKPGNIILLPNGEIKLLDFGIARVRQQQSEGHAAVDPGVPGAVTPAYSSMQVLTGEEPVAADDVFSLGCLMYRLIAGYRVFGPRNAAEAADEGMEPQRPQVLNDLEWAALRKALSYSRVSRFSSPQDFMDALSAGAPMRATQPVQTVNDHEIEVRRLWPSLLAVMVLIGGAWGLYQAGLLDQISSISLPGLTDNSDQQAVTEQLPPPEQVPVDEPVASDDAVPPDEGSLVIDSSDEVLVDDPSNEVLVDDPSNEVLVDDPADEALVVESTDEVLVDDPADEALVVEFTDEASADEPSDETLVVESYDEAQFEEEPVPQEVLVDYSDLPIATIEVHLASPGTVRTENDLIIREDQKPATIELVRASNIEDVLVVKLEEIGFSGNRSPWETGQYQISDSSVARFPAGQYRTRFTMSMTSDPLREPDRQVSLLVRDIDDAESEFALIRVTLEDDDQRRFESELEPNTVAFAVGQVSVRERDPAVQIDVVRFNPDHTAVTVRYLLRDVTATEGEDYFVPSTNTVEFGPGQRSARILVPLVQDSDPESDEAFVLEMPDLVGEETNANIFRRIAVMIRDDDSNLE